MVFLPHLFNALHLLYFFPMHFISSVYLISPQFTLFSPLYDFFIIYSISLHSFYFFPIYSILSIYFLPNYSISPFILCIPPFIILLHAFHLFPIYFISPFIIFIHSVF